MHETDRVRPPIVTQNHIGFDWLARHRGINRQSNCAERRAGQFNPHYLDAFQRIEIISCHQREKPGGHFSLAQAACLVRRAPLVWREMALRGLLATINNRTLWFKRWSRRLGRDGWRG